MFGEEMCKEWAINVENLNKICRFCMSEKELKPIRDFNRDELDLCDVIFKCASIVIIVDDKMPSNMCSKCINKFYDVHEFVEECKKSEHWFKEVLKQDKCNFEQECKLELAEETATYSDCSGDVKSELVMDEDDLPLVRKSMTPENQHRQNKSELIFSNKIPLKKRASYIRTVNGPPFVCVVCNEKFDAYASLKRHRTDLKHIRPVRFICDICNKGFTHKLRLEEHIRSHTGEKPHICATCDRKFNSKMDLKRHMLIHSDEKKYKCRFCEKGFNRKLGLKDHERSHTGEKLYCTCCAKEFTSYATLCQHERQKKVKVNIYQRYQKGEYGCDQCPRVLTTERSLQQHVLLHGPRNHNCEKCNHTFISAKRLLYHLRHTHGEELHACTFCRKEFKHRKGLSAHYMRSHSQIEKKPPAKQVHPCYICARICSSKQTLEQHVLQHGPKTAACDLCGKQYASEKRLKIHQAYAHNDKQYECSICKKVYKSKDGIEYHMRNHTGENLFACQVCPKEFKCKSSLRDHMRFHTGETKYKCPECDKVCLNKRKLQDHVRTHTGEKPYVCSSCGKSFAVLTNLTTHMRVHTGERRHVCEQCGKAFVDPRGLKKHALTHQRDMQPGLQQLDY